MKNDLLYQVALTMVPQIGCVHAKLLIDTFGSAEEVFQTKKSLLEKTDGIGSIRAASIKHFSNFQEAEEELKFIEQNQVTPLFINDPAYPQKLSFCYDPPVLLYYKGTADLNQTKIISVIGTRSNTEYGKQITEQILTDLSSVNPLVVSGLAYGIDAIAHRFSVKQQLSTVGVLAHGLDKIYPYQHASLAKEMLAQNGGLLTEFRSGTKPDRHNFPSRNRIVAGMADATIVIETSKKGGSMITAQLAHSYNRDVFAVPGKTTDPKSEGCNYLIQTQKAVLIRNGNDIAEQMGWNQSSVPKPSLQKSLFLQLNPEEQQVYNLLQQYKSLHIDEINRECRLTSSAVAAALLGLELQGAVLSLPGKHYCLS
ncbi:MAG: DNA-processing protein DprA [Chitinophagaceae bacterium]